MPAYKEYLCIECGTTEPEDFSQTMKGKCRKCENKRRWIARKNSKTKEQISKGITDYMKL